MERDVRLLCFTPAGSCGFAFTRADVFDMPVEERRRHVAWLIERREETRKATGG